MNKKIIFFFFFYFLVFRPTHVGFKKRRNFFTEINSPIKPHMHICPCLWAIGISNKIWIQTYFGPVTVNSVEVFCLLAFWHPGTRLASFLIVPKNCIFWSASFKLIKNLVTLVPEKLQVYETLLYHRHTLPRGFRSNFVKPSATWSKIGRILTAAKDSQHHLQYSKFTRLLDIWYLVNLNGDWWSSKAPCRGWSGQETFRVDERVTVAGAQDATTLRRVAIFLQNLANSWSSGNTMMKLETVRDSHEL